MKKTSLITIFASLLFSSVVTAHAATVILTNSTDTIGTFRTNVNTSLTNLNGGLVFTTTTILGLSATSYTFATGTSGISFNIATSAPGTITFNLPNASATSTGLTTLLAQSFEGIKTFLTGLVVNSGATFNTSSSNVIIFQHTGSAHNGLVYRTDAGGVHWSFTNPTTASTTSDGTNFGIQASGATVIRNNENSPIYFYTNALPHWYIDENGYLVSSSTERIGIGITNPTTELHVSGRGTFTSLGTNLVKSTSGILGNATSGMDYQAPITAGTNIVITASTSIAVTSTPSFSTTTITSAGSLVFPDATKQSTGYKEFAFNVYNASTTQNGVSSTIQKVFLKASTLVQVDCSTDGSSVTLVADTRSSSTPQTYGTQVFNGAGISCTSAGASTSTFSSTAINANTILNFGITVTPNATTTLRVSFRTKEQ